jgi:type IV pilus assembly protein PilA
MFSSVIQRLNDRRNSDGEAGVDAGFTLIELMVVLLILAILLAIAIPTFLGVTKSANDRASQSNLNTAVVNAKAAYQTNSQSYTGVNTTTLSSAEPSLSFTTGNSTAQGVISMSVSLDGNGAVFAAFSKSGNCWYQIDNPNAITATNSANTTAPYGATPTASGTTTAGNMVLPTTAGTTYAEAKGDSTASDCSAAAPKLSGSNAVWQTSTTQFPS